MSIITVDISDSEAVQTRFCLYTTLNQLTGL